MKAGVLSSSPWPTLTVTGPHAAGVWKSTTGGAASRWLARPTRRRGVRRLLLGARWVSPCTYAALQRCSPVLLSSAPLQCCSPVLLVCSAPLKDVPSQPLGHVAVTADEPLPQCLQDPGPSRPPAAGTRPPRLSAAGLAPPTHQPHKPHARQSSAQRRASGPTGGFGWELRLCCPWFANCDQVYFYPVSNGCTGEKLSQPKPDRAHLPTICNAGHAPAAAGHGGPADMPAIGAGACSLATQHVAAALCGGMACNDSNDA